MLRYFLVFLCASACSALILPTISVCGQINVTPLASVTNVGPLTGTWYELSDYSTPGSPVCQTATYTLIGQNQFSVYVNLTLNGNTILTTGLGSMASPGVLNFQIESEVSGQTSTEENQQTWEVLDTDYLNYLVVYSCGNVTPYSASLISSPEVAVLLRNPDPSAAVMKRAYALQSRADLSKYFRDHNCVVGSTTG